MAIEHVKDGVAGINIHIEISKEAMEEINKTLEHLKTLGPIISGLSGIAGLFGKKKSE